MPYGATPEEAAARQAKVAARRSAGAASSSSGPGAAGGLTLAAGPGGYVPRNKRRRRIPDEYLPKVRCGVACNWELGMDGEGWRRWAACAGSAVCWRLLSTGSVRRPAEEDGTEGGGKRDVDRRELL